MATTKTATGPYCAAPLHSSLSSHEAQKSCSPLHCSLASCGLRAQRRLIVTCGSFPTPFLYEIEYAKRELKIRN